MADSKTDVTHTLADALQKIESILSDDRNQGHYLTQEEFYQNCSDDPADLPQKIQKLAIELGSCVQSLHPPNFQNKLNIPVDTANILIKWVLNLEVSIMCLMLHQKTCQHVVNFFNS